MQGTSKAEGTYEPYTLITEKRSSKGRADTACDFYLPDYMGDVKRIMTAKAHPMSAGYNETESGISFSVVVGFSVLYLDAENKLTEAEFTSEVDIDLTKDGQVKDACVRLDVPSLAVRAAGPRKLSAKATVSAEVGMLVEKDMPPEDFIGGNETQREEVRVYSPRYLQPKELELAEEIAFVEDVSAEEIEVICQSANAFVPEVTRTGEGLALCTEIVGECVIMMRGESYARKTGRVKLDTALPAEWGEEIPDEVKIEVSSVTATVNNTTRDEDMKTGASVVINLVVEISGRYDSNESRMIVTDAFTPGAESELTRGTLELDELVMKKTVRENISFELTCEEAGIDGLGEPLRSIWQYKPCGMVYEGNTLLIEGELIVNNIGIVDGRVSPFKCTHPVKITEKIDIPSGTALVASARICASQCHFDSERVYFDTVLEIYLRGVLRRSWEAVYGITAGDKKEEPECSVCIYYPSEGDTLFSVAKKYGAPQEKIAQKNGIASLTNASKSDKVYLDKAKPIIIDKMG